MTVISSYAKKNWIGGTTVCWIKRFPKLKKPVHSRYFSCSLHLNFVCWLISRCHCISAKTIIIFWKWNCWSFTIFLVMKLTRSRSGPAMTLKITVEDIIIDVDLVPVVELADFPGSVRRAPVFRDLPAHVSPYGFLQIEWSHRFKSICRVGEFIWVCLLSNRRERVSSSPSHVQITWLRFLAMKCFFEFLYLMQNDVFWNGNSR